MKNFKMVIALAGGPYAEKVALTGLSFGKPLNAEIALISIVRPALDVSDDGATIAEISEELSLTYNESLQKLVNKVFKNYEVKTFVEKGKPYSTLLKFSVDWNADVIVMGIHAGIENAQFSRSTDFDEVIKRSTIPLLLVPSL